MLRHLNAYNIHFRKNFYLNLNGGAKLAQSYENILVAVDGSEGSEKALKRAISIAKKHDATLHLVHIVETYHFPGDTGSIRETQEKMGNELLDKYVKAVNEKGVSKVEKVLEFGHPRTHISKKTAKNIHADLIVCGATGLNALERMIGSVSEHIVRTAECDVLVVR